MGKSVIGIDLGTTNSCVSVLENGKSVVVVNSEGKRTTPSMVSFTKDEIKVGDPAKRQMMVNKDTIYSIKRLMGQKYDDLKSDFLKNAPFKIIKFENGTAGVEISGKKYTPQEISAMILQKMKKTAEDYLGHSVTDAVITVPAYFDDSARQATKDAGEIAGLNVLRIINEPTAAALAFGLDKSGDKKVAVFDAGGGTIDISILDIGDGIFEVKSTNGDVWLGGDLFDEKIIDWICDDFKSEYNVDLRKDTMCLQRLKDTAEKAKIELSSSTQTDINIPYITTVDGVPKHFNKVLNRSTFEKLIDEYLIKMKQYCDKAIKDSGYDINQITNVILVGGSTRIPCIQELVKKIFNKEPDKSVNPDEAVAEGAVLQAGVLSGEVEDILLLDVIPLSIGIETLGGVMTKMIESNTTIPTSKKETFSTASNNQTSIEVHILQGERPMAKDNKTLGRFHLDGILPAMRGIPQIEITMDIDANAILTVKAKDKATGKEQSIRIEGGTKLSNEEIERMKQDAKDNAEKDQKEKEKIETLNMADNLSFSTEKQLKEFGDKIPEEYKSKITEQVTLLKESRNKEDLEGIKKITESLNSVWNEASSKMYQNTQQQDPPKQEQNKEDNTETVDYEEIH